MVGWSETLSMFVAWGSEERAQDRLGSAMSLSGETPLWEEGYGLEDMGGAQSGRDIWHVDGRKESSGAVKSSVYRWVRLPGFTVPVRSNPVIWLRNKHAGL
jgi:hypothetical protein